MLNQVILVGRLVRTPELQLTESGKKKSSITLAVNRGYKNQNGEYDTDFIDCTLWTGIAENTAEYCKSGDVIGVKARLQTRLVDNDDGTKHKRTDIVAEKVTFLSSSKNNKVEKIDTDALDNEEDNSDNGDSSNDMDNLNKDADKVDTNEKKNSKKKK